MKLTLLALLGAIIALPSHAQAGVEIDDVKSYETATGMKVGVALMDIESEADDRLTGASTPAADRVEIHTMSEENGIMKMRKVDGGIALSANKELELSPNGYHLMLMDLKEPLKAGTTFPLTLTFEKAAEKTVTVTVKSRSELQDDLDDKEDDHHGHHGH